jgi:hypothetical protein
MPTMEEMMQEAMGGDDGSGDEDEDEDEETDDAQGMGGGAKPDTANTTE